MRRNAFSLLEIIIATAVLAASAMVLSSLIGLGARYGGRAEERTFALSQAESLLDEYLATLEIGNERQQEVTGELPGPPARSYRINVTPFDFGESNSSRGGESANARGGGLIRVTVEILETTGASGSTEAKPFIELSRLIRQPQAPFESNEFNGGQGLPSSMQDGLP